MSTFGDVKFYSSRAFLDDDDDDGDAQYDVPAVSVDWTEQPPPSVQTLLICFGDLANGYCRQEVLNDSFTVLGDVKASYSSSQRCGAEPAAVTVAQCHGRANTVVALCPDTRDADVANAVAQQLVSLLKCSPSSTTIVVTTEHISSLRAASQTYDDCSTFDAPVVVHCLVSPAFNRESPIGAAEGLPEAIKQLPQPAMIYSVPAAVLTACTLKKLACVVYVAFTETICGRAVDTIRTELSAVLGSHPVLHTLLEERGATRQRRELLYVPDNYS